MQHTRILDIETTHKKLPPAARPARHRALGAFWLLSAIAFFVLYILFRKNLLALPKDYQQVITNLAAAAGTGALILAFSAFIQTIIARRAQQRSQGYNLVQAIRLISILVVLVLFISFLFHNWYAAITSLGLISLILGFALQTPISSFIGWLYIIVRSPYRVTDRIQISGYKGDVVEIGYLDTTLWEFGGDYLSNDLPSGRLIRFPNSLVFQSAVYNYSWHRFPYIWNEIPFHVAYESDLAYVEETLRHITKLELGDEIMERVEELKQQFENSPLGELQVKEFPYISFRTNSNTWIEATVTYLVEPKKATETRTRILRKVLEALLLQPDKVLFPKTNNR